MSQPHTVLSTRSSLSSSPHSTATSIDSPLISDSVTNWEERHADHSVGSGSESSNPSDSGSPKAPWGLPSDISDVADPQDPNDPNLGDNDMPPYLGHTQWKQTRGLPHTPDQHHRTLSADRRNVYVDPTTLHQRTRSRNRHTYRNVYHEHYWSRDFFLLITLCFVLACCLICLTRPALISWLSGSPVLPDLDEL